MIVKAPLIALFALPWMFLSAVSAGEIESAPKTYVADRADIIDSATEQRLTGLLQELEQKTGARIIVLTVQSTNGQDIHQFAFERADTWKFGTSQKSASVLVVVAVKERKYRFEVGYDWGGVLPDGYVGQVGRDYFVPHFKAGIYSQAVLEATAALAEPIADNRGVTLTGMPKLRPMRGRRRRGLGSTLLGFLPILFILVVAGKSRGRRRNMLFWGLLGGAMLGGRGGGRGGGFGGGGFGGFGGGGGGGFGGGGASGGW